MIPLFKRLWFLLWHDEQSAVRWMRAFVAGCGAMSISAAAYVHGEWPNILRITGTVLISIAGMITAGQKNPTPETMTAIVENVQAKRAEGKPT